MIDTSIRSATDWDWSAVIFRLSMLAEQYGFHPKYAVGRDKGHCRISRDSEGIVVKELTYGGGSDEERAIVLAHEVAHAVLQHPLSRAPRVLIERDAWAKAEQLIQRYRPSFSISPYLVKGYYFRPPVEEED